VRLTPLRTLLALALVAACTQKVVFQTDRGDGGAGSGMAGSGGAGGRPPACPNGESASLDFRSEVSNVIVTLDRSTMNGAFGSSTKLQMARDLLTKLVSRYEHSVRFGYAAFPGPGCFQDACCGVQPSPLSQHGYQSFVTALRACDSPNFCPVSSERPTADALRGCLEAFASPNPPGADHVVLISDGPPGCTGNNDVCRDATLQVQELNFRSVKVNVFDLSPQGQGCLGDLSEIGNNQYENPDAGDFEAKLDRLLHEIANDACRLAILTPPMDPNQVTVLYKDEPIRRDWDRVNGWEFSNGFRTITIYGNACDTIVRGGNWEEDVDLIEDCRPPSPPN
jgi:hypothetical protein